MEYFVHLEGKNKGIFEQYLADRNIEYRVFEITDKSIFHVILEKNILEEVGKLEYIALVEPVKTVKMFNNPATF